MKLKEEFNFRIFIKLWQLLTKIFNCLVLMLSFGWSEARHPAYGLASVEGFCNGWGELDQLGDIASEIMNVKYPALGSSRVSKANNMIIHHTNYYDIKF